MSVAHESSSGLSEQEARLFTDVAQVFDVATEELAGWRINRIREDGAIDANIPIEHVKVTGVPTDPLNVRRLVKLFNKRALEVGGTGQRDPVVVGHVRGDAFYVLDGFHRHETQIQRGETYLHATIEPNLTFEQVINRRLEYAHVHPEIEFARQVEWMQSVWERTPWNETVPNVLTAFRACHDDYGYGGTDDIGLIDSLSDSVYEEIRAWVVERSKEWGYTPTQIRENLAKVESFDKDLIHLVYQKSGKPPAGKIVIRQVEAISAAYGGEFDIQQAVVKVVTDQELTPAQTDTLLEILQTDTLMNAKDVLESARDIDFNTLKARTKQHGKKPAKYYKNSEVSTDISAIETLRAIRELLPKIKAEALNGKWGTEEVSDALEITMVLSETLAQLSILGAQKNDSDQT